MHTMRPMRMMNRWGAIAFGAALVWASWMAWPALVAGEPKVKQEEQEEQKNEQKEQKEPEVIERQDVEELKRPGVELTFQQADTDRDGFLTRQEAADAFDWAGGLFKVIDQDGDKKISQGEFQTWSLHKRDLADEGKAAAVFHEMDRLGNRDGKVSLKKWWGSQTVFELKDTDKNGFLTLQEFLEPVRQKIR